MTRSVKIVNTTRTILTIDRNEVMKSLVLFTLCTLLVAGCATTPVATKSITTEPAISKPTTSDGLTPLTTSELSETFTGKSFRAVSGNWTWNFEENGLANSKHKDGSWEHKAQDWTIEDGKLCRSRGEAYPCVNIYKVGDVIYFGLPDSDELEDWAITEI